MDNWIEIAMQYWDKENGIFDLEGFLKSDEFSNEDTFDISDRIIPFVVIKTGTESKASLLFINEGVNRQNDYFIAVCAEDEEVEELLDKIYESGIQVSEYPPLAVVFSTVCGTGMVQYPEISMAIDHWYYESRFKKE